MLFFKVRHAQVCLARGRSTASGLFQAIAASCLQLLNSVVFLAANYHTRSQCSTWLLCLEELMEWKIIPNLSLLSNKKAGRATVCSQ